MGDGFKHAVEVLGRAFLAHPANRGLRRRLNEGTLTAQAYRDEIVIRGYRLVLVSAADDGGALESLLAGGWSQIDGLTELAGCKLASGDLLAALRQLRPVPGADELTTFHEEMLAAEPAVDVKGRGFEPLAAAGLQRKHTGSYYTPALFVESLLESALEPAMEEAVKRARREQRRVETALLGLRICDPACGAGNFLVAAARRMARRLAAERGGGRVHSAAMLRAALRGVIEHCIYGVDISRTAVELCRLVLQLELLSVGARAGEQLNRHIVCGNALIPAAAKHPAEGGWDTHPAGLEGAEYDVAIGNPPYRATMTERERQVARELYPLAAPASNSAADFVELCSRMVRPGGYVGLVVPKSLTYSYSWRRLRAAVAPSVVSAIDLRRGWADVLLEQVLLTFRPGGRRRSFVRIGMMRDGKVRPGRVKASLIERLGILPTGLSRDEVKLLECMLEHSAGTLADVCSTRRGTGLQRMLRLHGDMPVVGGKDIQAFGPLRPRSYIRSADLAGEGVRWTEPPQVIFQNIIAHVTRPVDHIRLIGTLARERVACLDTVNLITIREPALGPELVCGLLMSELVGWYVYACIYNKAVRTMHFDGYFLAKIPMPGSGSFGAFAEAAGELEREPGKADHWRRLNGLVLDAYGVPRGAWGLRLGAWG